VNLLRAGSKSFPHQSLDAIPLNRISGLPARNDGKVESVFAFTIEKNELFADGLASGSVYSLKISAWQLQEFSGAAHYRLQAVVKLNGNSLAALCTPRV
jgi:hypothetical protein